MKTRSPTRSAGVVIVRPTPDGWRFLLLRAYRHWDFPKGQLEADESPLAAAQREVREETGLTAPRFAWGEAFCETPPYGRGKVARYYLAMSERDEVTLPLNPEIGRPEHHEFRWLDYRAARALLVPRLQTVLDWAEAQLGA